MALSQSTQLGLAIASFGVLSFVLAALAELKKPPYGTPIKGSGTRWWRWARCPRSPPRAAPGSAPSPSSSLTAAGASRGRCCSAAPRSRSSSTSPCKKSSNRSTASPQESRVCGKLVRSLVFLSLLVQRRHDGRFGHDGVVDGDRGRAPRQERAPRPGERLPNGQDRCSWRRGVPQPGRHIFLDHLPHARRQCRGGLLRPRRRRCGGRRGDRVELTSQRFIHVASASHVDKMDGTHYHIKNKLGSTPQ